MRTTTPLSSRDKASIQTVTRHSDAIWNHPYQFTVPSGMRVTFTRPGTTSAAGFPVHSDDLQDIQRYIADLALFAFRRLIRKHGVERARGLIHPDVYVYDKRWNCRLRLWEVIEEHTGYTREALESEVAK